MLLGLRLLEDSYSYFKKLSLLLKKHIWYMTYTSETGSEAMFCWQYSRSKCKHALSVKSGGRTVGRICSSGPISFSHYISWGSELWAPVCVCVCVCLWHMCACPCVISCIKPLSSLGNWTIQFTCFDWQWLLSNQADQKSPVTNI